MRSRTICAGCAAIVFIFASAIAFGAPDPARLAPGEFLWYPEVAPTGPIVVVVSLDEQRAYVYRNGVAIGLSTISTGKKGFETPTGVFSILERAREHRSNKYDDAPMPFMERLTWDGVAMHAGRLPGRPASHGCIRLPQAFAEKLYAITRRGQTIVIASARAAAPSVVHPAVLAPVTPDGRPAAISPSAEGFEWDDHAAPSGPISVVVSIRDRFVHVMREGIRIASAELSVAPDFVLRGPLLFVVAEGFDDERSRVDPLLPRHRWTLYPLTTPELPMSMDELALNLRVPDAFARRLYDQLSPGTTLLVTDLPAVRVAASDVQTVLQSDAPKRRR